MKQVCLKYIQIVILAQLDENIVEGIDINHRLLLFDLSSIHTLLEMSELSFYHDKLRR